jgi:hypothetical protein
MEPAGNRDSYTTWRIQTILTLFGTAGVVVVLAGGIVVVVLFGVVVVVVEGTVEVVELPDVNVFGPTSLRARSAVAPEVDPLSTVA